MTFRLMFNITTGQTTIVNTTGDNPEPITIITYDN